MPQTEQQQIEALLKKQRPNYRQGYSDRTAWLMACLSELAYRRYNPFSLNSQAGKAITKALTKSLSKSKINLFSKAVEMSVYDHEHELALLKNELKDIEAELIWTGDQNGTQCIIVRLSDSYALAFRGTEANSYKDIKTDIQANKIPASSDGQIHKGFYEAYQTIKHPLKSELRRLAKIEDLPLYITGHSLGGALAVIATKDLHEEFKIAACYNFGAPKVANHKWIYGMSSPVYRIVNAVDAVTMLPPTVLVEAACWGLRFVPFVGRAAAHWIHSTYGEYMHAGDMRYLTNITDGDFSKVELLPHVSLLYRLRQYLRSKRVASDFLNDHKISIYRKKLFIIAHRKNV